MFSLVQVAQASSHVVAAQGFVDKINKAILFPLIMLMMAVAFLFFLYGAFEYVKNANNESARETGRNHLMYGVIGMLVMLSALAILNIAAGTFGLSVPSSSSAPETSLRPQARPDRAPATSPAGPCYSLGDCGPSQRSDPYDALREELQYSGGIALGTPRMTLVETGEKSMALAQIDEYYRLGHITPETRDRLIVAVGADTTHPGQVSTNPLPDINIPENADPIPVGGNGLDLSDPRSGVSEVPSVPIVVTAADFQSIRDNLIINGISVEYAEAIVIGLQYTNTDTGLHANLEPYVTEGLVDQSIVDATVENIMSRQ